MTDLTIDRHVVGAGQLCLTVAGEVDYTTVGQLEAAIRTSLREYDLTRLVVDLEQVTFLDSDGIRILLIASNIAARQSITFRVANPHHNVRRVLEITGIYHVLVEP